MVHSSSVHVHSQILLLHYTHCPTLHTSTLSIIPTCSFQKLAPEHLQDGGLRAKRLLHCTSVRVEAFKPHDFSLRGTQLVKRLGVQVDTHTGGTWNLTRQRILKF